jgi:hypothetical protein
MKWFGPAPFSHACSSPEVERVPVPLACCVICDGPFEEDHCGYVIPGLDADLTPIEYPYHVACFISTIVPKGRGA